MNIDTLDTIFTDTADAIRAKLRTQAGIKPENFADNIDNISGESSVIIIDDFNNIDFSSLEENKIYMLYNQRKEVLTNTNFLGNNYVYLPLTIDGSTIDFMSNFRIETNLYVLQGSFMKFGTVRGTIYFRDRLTNTNISTYNYSYNEETDTFTLDNYEEEPSIFIAGLVSNVSMYDFQQNIYCDTYHYLGTYRYARNYFYKVQSTLNNTIKLTDIVLKEDFRGEISCSALLTDFKYDMFNQLIGFTETYMFGELSYIYKDNDKYFMVKDSGTTGFVAKKYDVNLETGVKTLIKEIEMSASEPAGTSADVTDFIDLSGEYCFVTFLDNPKYIYKIYSDSSKTTQEAVSSVIDRTVYNELMLRKIIETNEN